MTVATPERRTALYEEHVALGARLVPFAGFQMPLQYASILKEHDAVRQRAGLFDLSHMAQFELFGEEVGPWADLLTVNNVANMKVWQARYNLFCNEHGGTRDDVLFYRRHDRWLLVANASNGEKIWNLLSSRRTSGVTLENRHGAAALIAVQGPRALEILTPLASTFDAPSLAEMKYYTCTRAAVAGIEALVARTGYTGEDGFELFVEGADAAALWRALLDEGKPQGLEPCGLGARDVLRLEAGMPLYGHELTEAITPLAAGQRWAVKLSKPEFTGRAALLAQAERDDFDRVAGTILEGKVPARQGYAVYRGDERVGEVKSASIAPSLGNRQVATVYIRKDAATEGTQLGIDVRGTRQGAQVVPLPFYSRRKT